MANRRLRRGPLLVLALAAFIALGFADLGFLLTGRLQALGRSLEEDLGRPVHIGPAHLRLLPTLQLWVEDLRVAGLEGAPPLLSLRALRVEAPLSAALRSLRDELHLSALVLDGLELQVARLPDGRLSHEAVVQRLRERRRPLSPEQRRRIAATRIGAFAVSGALRCQDGAGGAAVEQFSLRAEGVRVSAPIPVRLEAALLRPDPASKSAQGGGPVPTSLLPSGPRPEPNLRLDAQLGPVPADLEVGEPAALLRRAELRAGPVPLAPLRCLTGVPAAGTVEATEISLELPAAAGRMRLRGQARIGGLRQGPVELRATVDADPLAGDLQVEALELRVGDRGLLGRADLRRLWTTPELHRLELSSRGLRVEDLLGFMPGGRGRGGAVLSGPASLSVAASGPPARASVRADLDLPEATLRLPSLHEEVRLPLQLLFRGQLEPGGLDIERLGLKIGPATLQIRGKLQGRHLVLQPLPTDMDLAALGAALPALRDRLPVLLQWVRRVRPAGSVNIELARGLPLEGVVAFQFEDGRRPLELRLTGSLLDPRVSRLSDDPPADGPGPLGQRLERLRERLWERLPR